MASAGGWYGTYGPAAVSSGSRRPLNNNITWSLIPTNKHTFRSIGRVISGLECVKYFRSPEVWSAPPRRRLHHFWRRLARDGLRGAQASYTNTILYYTLYHTIYHITSSCVFPGSVLSYHISLYYNILFVMLLVSARGVWESSGKNGSGAEVEKGGGGKTRETFSKKDPENAQQRSREEEPLQAKREGNQGPRLRWAGRVTMSVAGTPRARPGWARLGQGWARLGQARSGWSWLVLPGPGLGLVGPGWAKVG